MSGPLPITVPTIRSFINARSDLEVLRIRYCYQIGSTFVNLALMEDTIINAMSICDRIEVANVLGTDASNWERLIKKTNSLQSSTLGNLIAILSKHSVVPRDLDYLKWVKSKRDFFVHRFFQKGWWPGDLVDNEIEAVCRKLLYLEIIFIRASRQIWKIFGRSNLMQYEELEGGILMTNLDLHTYLDEG